MSGPARARYAPDAEAVRSARRFVEQQLSAAGRGALADDAGLICSELAANAVMHARSPFEVAVVAVEGGVRVEVHDDSPALPVLGTTAQTAMSGRGLVLVAALATRWGTERTPGCGKAVWFEVAEADREAADDAEGPSADELLAMWSDVEDEPAPEPSVVIADLPVGALLAAKEHMDDLVRELQLVMLNPAVVQVLGQDAPEEVRLARRLDAAVSAFSHARVQVRTQVARAAAAGRERVTIELALEPRAAEDARRYRDAVEAAEQLSRSGALLTGPATLAQHAEVRRHYLDQIITQLGG